MLGAGSGARRAGAGDARRAGRGRCGAAGGRPGRQDDGYGGPHAKCGGGDQASYAGSRAKTVTHGPGPGARCAGPGITARRMRARLRAARLSSWAWPATSLSPGLAEMIALAGAEVSFGSAAGAAGRTWPGSPSSARTIERSAEAAGAAARAAAGRRGRRAPCPARSSRCPRPSRSRTCCMPRSTAPACRSAPAKPRAGRAKTRTAAGRDQGDQARPVLHRLPASMMMAGR